MPPEVDEILAHLDEETSARWQEVEKKLEIDLDFDEEDVFVRMYAGDDEFNRSVPNDKFGSKWFYTRGQGALPVHAGGGLNMIRMIERNVRALSYDRDLEEDTKEMIDEIVKSIHDNHEGAGRESEDVRDAAKLESHVSDMNPDSVDRDDRYRINDSGEVIYDPEQELRRRYDRDEKAVEALQESFGSLFELFKSFKTLRFFYMSALEEVSGEQSGQDALRNNDIDEGELFEKLEEKYDWSNKVNEFTQRYANLIETRLADYREELEQMGHRRESQIDKKPNHSHQRFF